MSKSQKVFGDLTEKAQLSIDQICLKAAEVFSEKGFLSATLKDVSLAAGISKGGIYHYFLSKEELLYFIINRYMDKILKDLKEKLEAKPPTEERIRLFINRHIELYCKNIPESRLVIREINNLPPEYWEMVRGKSKQYYQLLLFSI